MVSKLWIIWKQTVVLRRCLANPSRACGRGRAGCWLDAVTQPGCGAEAAAREEKSPSPEIVDTSAGTSLRTYTVFFMRCELFRVYAPTSPTYLNYGLLPYNT